MEGLTAKVFRTYNASRTLQEQLDLMTNGKQDACLKFIMKLSITGYILTQSQHALINIFNFIKIYLAAHTWDLKKYCVCFRYPRKWQWL